MSDDDSRMIRRDEVGGELTIQQLAGNYSGSTEDLYLVRLP
mgnify:CR=1 FL=1